jgi:hypothetical protein
VTAIRQSSFTGGELDPALHGRTDLRKYSAGLKRCRNFKVNPAGSLSNRPGTQFLGFTKYVIPGRVRLVPFKYSDSQSYVLEFGPIYVRIWSNGGRVESSPGVPIELVTPYLTSELATLNFAQVGDVMTFAQGAHPAYELKRFSHTSWQFSAVTFNAADPLFAPTEIYIDADGMGGLWSPDATHPLQRWQWWMSKLYRNDDGSIVETTAAPVIATKTGPASFNPYPDQIVLATDKPVRITVGTVGALPATLVGWRLYRGNNIKRRGWIADLDVGVAAANRFFTDMGKEPAYGQAPVAGTNPFQVYDSAGTLLRTENPLTVGFFENRRVFGGTIQRPQTLFASAVNAYANFDDHDPVNLATDAVEFTLAARTREEFHWLTNLGPRLIPGTNSAIWSFGGSQGPLTFASVDAKVQSEVGANWMPPLIAAGSLLYARTKGSGVRDLVFSQERGAYGGSDLTVFAKHLFKNHTLKEWAWCEDPYSVVWAVREDGCLLSCTYLPEQEVYAWSWHDTQGGEGKVRSVCSVPEGDEDVLYLAVERPLATGPSLCVERLRTREIMTAAEGCFLDCSLSYQGTPTNVVTGAGHLEGMTDVWAVADGQVIGPVAVTGGAVNLGLPGDRLASTVHVGLRYVSELQTLDLAEQRTLQKNVIRATVEVYLTRGTWLGQYFEHLTETKQRRVFDAFAPLEVTSDDLEVTLRSNWDSRGGYICLRQVDPLPITVLAITREVKAGGS